MTLLVEAGSAPPAPVRPGFVRRHRLLLAIVAVVVVAAAGLTTWLVLKNEDEKYGPISGAYAAGPYSLRNIVVGRGDHLRLSSEPGARAELFDALRNKGSHSVKITSVQGDASVAHLQWSTYRVVNGGSLFGLKARWHDFPAVIPARGWIRLRVTVQRPSGCPTTPQPGGAGLYYSGSYRVHWESLLGSHTSTVQTLYGDSYDFKLC